MSSWIFNIIDPKLHTSVAYTNMAKATLDTLKRHYVATNAPKIHHLKISIGNCKQGGLSVVKFYSKIMDLWYSLRTMIKSHFIPIVDANVE